MAEEAWEEFGFRFGPFEVGFSGLGHFIKQTRDLTGSRIRAGEVRAFIGVAEAARQRQILYHRLAAVLFGDDMVNVEGQFGEGFREMTVFAPVLSPGADGHLGRLVNGHAQAASRRSSSDRRALALRNSSARPTFR